ncbi:hypothetical protein BDV12DRAFT_163658, partial [Aspergillus spectabilis]
MVRLRTLVALNPGSSNCCTMKSPMEPRAVTWLYIHVVVVARYPRQDRSSQPDELLPTRNPSQDLIRQCIVYF